MVPMGPSAPKERGHMNQTTRARTRSWRRHQKRAVTLSLACGALVASGATALSANTAWASGQSAQSDAASSACKPGAVKLTFWGWAPGYNLVVNEFNKTHPNICVTLEDNGAAIDEYTKLAAAVKAGSGAPDIAEIEYLEVPAFEVNHSLLNLAKYGVAKFKSDIVPFVWDEVSQGSAVYSMPGDIGPMAFNYNATLLGKYHITPPSTWAQFAVDAATLHKDDPSAYLANFDPVESQWLFALMQGWGCFPFSYAGGTKVTINFTGAAQMAFADYWQKLISADEINHTSDFVPIFWHNLDNDIDASWLDAAWSPADMAANMTKTVGDWRVAPMPQLKPGGDLVGAWGGSSWAVMAQTKYPKQAAEFVEWYGGTLQSWKILNSPAAGAFPGYKPLLDSPALKNAQIPLTGSSKPNVVYTEAAAHVQETDWPPFMTEVQTQAKSIFAGVLNGNETVPAAFKLLQSTVVAYAKSQGFNVTQ